MSGDDPDVAQAPRLPLSLSLPAAVFVAVLAWGVWQTYAAARVPAEPSIQAGWEDLRTGRSFAALDSHLEQNLPAREDLIALAQAARYLLTGSGGERVRVGGDGWLYLTDELRFYPEAARNQTARLRLIAETRQTLARRGVELVVALVPDKARVHGGPLGRLPSHVRGRYAAALAALRGMGVPTADLLTPLGAAAAHGEVYYRSDTHWNQAGARIAAEAVAAEVRALGRHWEPEEFVTETAGPEAERPGDLIRLMGLDKVPAWLRPPSDREAPERTRRLGGGGGGLFGDTRMPVVLAGTSYALRGNFHGRLQQALAAEVLNTAQDGGGFLTAMTEYLKDEAFRTAPPEVLIWEVPERLLPAPPEGEEGWLAQVGLEEAADSTPSTPL